MNYLVKSVDACEFQLSFTEILEKRVLVSVSSNFNCKFLWIIRSFFSSTNNHQIANIPAVGVAASASCASVVKKFMASFVVSRTVVRSAVHPSS